MAAEAKKQAAKGSTSGRGVSSKSRRKVSIVLAEGHVVYVDGRSYGAGETLELPPDEARTLIEDGQALPAPAKRRGR